MWDRYQHKSAMAKCESEFKQGLGRELRSGEEIELFKWCYHRVSGGLFDHTYRPLLPRLWAEYYRRKYPNADPCAVHIALC